MYCSPVSGQEAPASHSACATAFPFCVTQGTELAVAPDSGVQRGFGSLWGAFLVALEVALHVRERRCAFFSMRAVTTFQAGNLLFFWKITFCRYPLQFWKVK